MDTIVKSVVTGAVVIAIAWPLLFWSGIDNGDSNRVSRHALLTSSFEVVFPTLDQDVAQLLIAR
jgi:hypothetical protein